MTAPDPKLPAKNGWSPGLIGGAHLDAAYECAEAIQQALTFPDEIEANNPSSQGC